MEESESGTWVCFQYLLDFLPSVSDLLLSGTMALFMVVCLILLLGLALFMVEPKAKDTANVSKKELDKQQRNMWTNDEGLLRLIESLLERVQKLEQQQSKTRGPAHPPQENNTKTVEKSCYNCGDGSHLVRFCPLPRGRTVKALIRLQRMKAA